jgi:porin
MQKMSIAVRQQRAEVAAVATGHPSAGQCQPLETHDGRTLSDREAVADEINAWSGIPGFSTHTSIINRAGRNASADYVGDTVIQAQEIYGAGFGVGAKLVWFYGEEKLFDDRVNIAFGRFAPGLDYNASPLHCNFMTLTICGHDRALTANQGFEDWPMSERSARIRVRPTDQTYITVGAFQSQPFPTPTEPYTQGGHSGGNWTFKGTTGASIPVEISYTPLIGEEQMPGH